MFVFWKCCVLAIPNSEHDVRDDEDTSLRRERCVRVQHNHMDAPGYQKLHNSILCGHIRVLLIDTNLMIHICYIQ